MAKLISKAVSIAVVTPMDAAGIRWVPCVLDRNYPGYPTNGDTPFGGKHRRFIYSNIHRKIDGSTVVDSEGGSSSGYVWVFGGDFHGVPYTGSQVPNYPTVESTWALDSGRQDHWRAPVQEIDGKVRIEMACNQVAFYPYPGGPNPDPAITQPGPPHPDGVGLVFDKRGDVWIGPGYYRWPIVTNPPSHNPDSDHIMYRFRLPNKHTDGIRMGNGWHVPSQNRLILSEAERKNADDLVIGNAPSFLFGGSNVWTAYDPVEDAVIFCGQMSPDSVYLFSFPVSPGLSRNVWTRKKIARTGGKSQLLSFLNQYIRDGAAPFTSTSMPSKFWSGHQMVAGDHLFVACAVGVGPYGSRNISYLFRINLRDHADQELIGLPAGAHWIRNFDAPLGSNQSELGVQSVNEYRDVQAMGSLIVFGPPADNYDPDDPWCYWYDTLAKKWTLGLSYNQMKIINPSLPEAPYSTVVGSSSKGRMCVVPETSELWFITPRGVLKYRIAV